MIGDIYNLPIHDDREGWVARNMLVLDLCVLRARHGSEALPYNKSYLAAKCLILDTGEHTNIYVDTLRDSGKKVA